MKPTYKAHTEPEGERHLIQFRTSRPFSHSNLEEAELAQAIYEAAVDAAIPLNDLKSREEVYQVVLDRINASEFMTGGEG